MPQCRVAVSGFGRIGRALARMLLGGGAPKGLRLAAINDPSSFSRDPDNAAEPSEHLLKNDSTPGVFDKKIKEKKNTLQVNNARVPLLAQRDAAQLPWRSAGVDIVLECSGALTDGEAARAHLRAGAKRVIISAPAKNPDFTAVYGVNDGGLRAAHKVVSAASCTTNCLAPVVKIVDAQAGIARGWLGTVHATTQDQRLLDSAHRDRRRARAAAASIIPARTGAAAAMGGIFPRLRGRLRGAALRVPVANVSLAELTAQVNKKTSKEKLLAAFAAAAKGKMRGVLAVSNAPLVSRDFLGRAESAIVDADLLDVVDGRFVKVSAWYDNEWGFARRMLDIAAKMAGTPRGK